MLKARFFKEPPLPLQAKTWLLRGAPTIFRSDFYLNSMRFRIELNKFPYPAPTEKVTMQIHQGAPTVQISIFSFFYNRVQTYLTLILLPCSYHTVTCLSRQFLFLSQTFLSIGRCPFQQLAEATTSHIGNTGWIKSDEETTTLRTLLINDLSEPAVLLFIKFRAWVCLNFAKCSGHIKESAQRMHSWVKSIPFIDAVCVNFFAGSLPRHNHIVELNRIRIWRSLQIRVMRCKDRHDDASNQCSRQRQQCFLCLK